MGAIKGICIWLLTLGAKQGGFVDTNSSEFFQAVGTTSSASSASSASLVPISTPFWLSLLLLLLLLLFLWLLFRGNSRFVCIYITVLMVWMMLVVIEYWVVQQRKKSLRVRFCLFFVFRVQSCIFFQHNACNYTLNSEWTESMMSMMPPSGKRGYCDYLRPISSRTAFSTAFFSLNLIKCSWIKTMMILFTRCECTSSISDVCMYNEMDRKIYH